MILPVHTVDTTVTSKPRASGDDPQSRDEKERIRA